MIKRITLIALAFVAYAISANAAVFKLYIAVPEDSDVPFYFVWGATNGMEWPGEPMDEDDFVRRGGKTFYHIDIETDKTEVDKQGNTVGKIDGLVINDGGGLQSNDFDVNMVGQGWYEVVDWADKDNGYVDLTSTYYPYRPDVVVVPEYQEDWIPADLPAYDGTFAYCVNDTKGASVNVWAWNDEGNLFTSWPGLDLGAPVAQDTQGNDIYLWKKDASLADPTMIIFSNAGNPQTADLEFVNGGYYCITKHKGGKLVKVIEGGGPQPILGDLNGDGNVNTGDVSALYSALLAGNTDTKFDLNGDGNVNTGDVSTLYAIILGN